MRQITETSIQNYRSYLMDEEKSSATLEKYLRDVCKFATWLQGREFGKSDVLTYKTTLSERYAVRSVNSIISSLNSFFLYNEWHELRVKMLKVQKRIFSERERELTKSEYFGLLACAKNQKNDRLYLLMQTICSTGIRVSELRFITVEAVLCARAEIQCKGKRRTVFLSADLCKLLKKYLREKRIKSGSVFVTKSGKPLDRSNIWSEMKRLCKSAGISEKKVFPHNLRHLFARTFYSVQKDVVRLADILGHSSVNTTRIYTMESGEVHRRQIQHLGLLRC